MHLGQMFAIDSECDVHADIHLFITYAFIRGLNVYFFFILFSSLGSFGLPFDDQSRNFHLNSHVSSFLTSRFLDCSDSGFRLDTTRQSMDPEIMAMLPKPDVGPDLEIQVENALKGPGVVGLRGMLFPSHPLPFPFKYDKAKGSAR